jgi:hypothetical protein
MVRFIQIGLTAVTSAGGELRLELLNILEIAVGMVDQLAFGRIHLSLDPLAHTGHIRVHSRHVVIVASHGPAGQTGQNVTTVSPLTD